RAFRSKNASVSFEFIAYTLDKYGIADFFTPFEKFLLLSFLNLGKFAPTLSVPFFIKHLRDDTKTMVLDANEDFLKPHILKRKDENKIILNVNLIGEEVLGEAESKQRIQKYEEALKSSYITYISIKITTIFSQINIIDFEYSKNEVVKRLDALYALAQSEEKRQGIAKFINLDMEEFRDLELTVAAFMQSIDKFDIKAGIVLQAYIPDSFEYLKKLFEFSKQRVQSGKKPIKIRFVKGANMESEETISSQRGWDLPTFSRKIDTDSNYNKMLDFILQDDNYKFINIGIASHNIFELAYAYTKISELNALEYFSFEMLEGMSLQCAYELSKLHQLVLYAPVCDEAHFNNAIAYLVRRLDENTSEDNFMRHFFNLKVNSPSYKQQEELFLASLKGIQSLDNSTRRKQDRNKKSELKAAFETGIFKNESDTDFVLAQNRLWASKIKKDYEHLSGLEIYPVIGETIKKANLKEAQIFDKINNEQIATVYQAGEEEIKLALKVALNSSFNQRPHEEIHRILAKVAQNLRDKRGELIGIAARETGKSFLELDPEVSEAIDFVEFYPHSLQKLKEQNSHTKFTPKGIGVTIAPWNFPIGISVGTIAAPLAAGNVVIY
ncbi:proline dehydrogenase family protein, partial [Campylobacter troglodytis]|uniref:proline dehydrogenase family protein n=1 Tax=Campylobacter troglodytis TaxID=654363 RepID=UPI0011589348